MATDLRAPLTVRAVHLCVDMQRLFSLDGPWPTPWLDRVLPVAVRLAERFPERTVFTRFIPPRTPDEMPGSWRHYYERWRNATREHADPSLIALLPPLASFAPPAQVIDKTRYSAFALSTLAKHLAERSADAVIVTGVPWNRSESPAIFGSRSRSNPLRAAKAARLLHT